MVRLWSDCPLSNTHQHTHTHLTEAYMVERSYWTGQGCALVQEATPSGLNFFYLSAK